MHLWDGVGWVCTQFSPVDLNRLWGFFFVVLVGLLDGVSLGFLMVFCAN